MTSTIYRQHYADGTSELRRRTTPQGRKPAPPELVKIKMEFRTLPATRARIAEAAKRHNMTVSAYIDLAVSLFDISEFLSYKNCSKQ